MQGTSIRSLVWEEPHLGSNQACQFSRLVMSDSLWPHGLQHTMLPCLSPTPGACSNSCPLSPWSHPIISPSVVPVSKVLEFQLQHQSSRDYSGLISFRIVFEHIYSMENCTKNLSNEELLMISTFLLSPEKSQGEILLCENPWREQLPRNVVLPGDSVMCRKNSNGKTNLGKQRCFPALLLYAGR